MKAKKMKLKSFDSSGVEPMGSTLLKLSDRAVGFSTGYAMERQLFPIIKWKGL
jgi:hypothetical protein